MKLYEIYDRETGLGFSKFDNMNGYAPVWKAKPKQYKSYPIVRENLYELLPRKGFRSLHCAPSAEAHRMHGTES